jgi:hypothetical protein
MGRAIDADGNSFAAGSAGAGSGLRRGAARAMLGVMEAATRVPPEQFRSLPLEVHALLADVPLSDVTAIDLPAGGPGRTVEEVRTLFNVNGTRSAGLATRSLFALRWWLGRVFGWDRRAHDHPAASYLPRVDESLRARSQIPPGTMQGAFRLLYLLDRESLSEIRNATVHAFLCVALREQPGGYRLYWAVYVKPTSWLTTVYMAVIEPFRRFVVYPALFGRIRQRWCERYPSAPSASPG